jgi:hypothetical protein
MANKISQPVLAVVAKQKPAAKSTDRTAAAPTRVVDSAAYASLNLDNLQPADILTLQRTIGNSATTRLIQTKLTVGPAGDQYEQEADRVAAQVMTMPAPAETQPALQRAPEEEELQMKPLAAPLAASITPLVQRAAEEEDELQMKPLAERVQRLEEEEELQAKPDVQRAATGAGFEVGGEFEQQLAASRGGGSPLPAEVRSFMEPRFGADFSGVRVHAGSESAQLNRSVSAQAFTHGQDIYLGEGKDDLESAQGKQLLAHELTHVVQQTGQSQLSRQMQRSRLPAVIQRVIFAEGNVMSGKVLEPMPVNYGTGTHSNLKWNKGGGASGQGKYNTGFWQVQGDTGLELHVHFSDGGGLVSGGGVAHHFKRGATPKGSVSNSDLQSIFGSTKVSDWNKASYTIP